LAAHTRKHARLSTDHPDLISQQQQQSIEPLDLKDDDVSRSSTDPQDDLKIQEPPLLITDHRPDKKSNLEGCHSDAKEPKIKCSRLLKTSTTADEDDADTFKCRNCNYIGNSARSLKIHLGHSRTCAKKMTKDVVTAPDASNDGASKVSI
jgi:hypothetical protein